MPIFEANEITKQYAGHLALDSVSLKVDEGSIYGLLGPNGAGKTTLIRIINRITAPDKGFLFFQGQPFSNIHAEHIGYLPEERGLYRKMKVGEQALYLSQLKGLKESEARKRLKYWFEKLDISSWWNRRVDELSKGMAQKIQFIVTVIHEPQLLIFDEPFSGFDPVNANILKEEILALQKKGATIIFSTHDMASVEELCDSITLINRAKTILEGTVAEITEKFKENLFELEYLGDPDHLKSQLNGVGNIIKHESLFNGHHLARMKLSDGKAANDLLRQVIDVVTVRTFREVLPSMNEIFIKSVNSLPTFQNHE